VVASRTVQVCPNRFNTQKATPDAATTSPYTFACSFNPFQLGSVWGLASGWGTDPFEFGRPFRLSLGTYHVTETIAPRFVRLLNISAADATAYGQAKGGKCT